MSPFCSGDYTPILNLDMCKAAAGGKPVNNGQSYTDWPTGCFYHSAPNAKVYFHSAGIKGPSTAGLTGTAKKDTSGQMCVLKRPRYMTSESQLAVPKDLVNNGGSAHTKGKMGACEGDCDRDSHCKPGLKCFQRNGNQKVPQCNTYGSGNVRGYDYCYDPTTSQNFCTKGYSPVMTMAQCTEAKSFLSLIPSTGKVGPGTWTDWPIGCFYNKNGASVVSTAGALSFCRGGSSHLQGLARALPENGTIMIFLL